MLHPARSGLGPSPQLDMSTDQCIIYNTYQTTHTQVYKLIIQKKPNRNNQNGPGPICSPPLPLRFLRPTLPVPSRFPPTDACSFCPSCGCSSCLLRSRTNARYRPKRLRFGRLVVGVVTSSTGTMSPSGVPDPSGGEARCLAGSKASA